MVNYQEQYQPGSLRYEVGGHSNFILVPMLLQSIKQLNDWGTTGIQDYCRELSGNILEEIKSLGFGIEEADHRVGHLVGIRLPEMIDHNRLIHNLDKNQVYLSFRGDAVRVSIHLYNTPRDMERLWLSFRDL